jgi:predicted ArsR family transcriptional regulator
MTLKQKIFTHLIVEGKKLTAAQLATQLRTTQAVVRARISELRRAGFVIYANRQVNSKGQEKTFYTTGKPTRKLIAAGYRALALGL